MAGEGSAGFAERFRAGITRAMTIGLAPDPAERPTFHWDRPRTFAAHDPAGRPWGPNQTPAVGAGPADVQVPCGVQVKGEGDDGETTSVGIINADELILTFLDVDWAKVAGFDSVTISGRPYKQLKRLPTVGLFDVGVVRILVGAAG